MKLYLDDNVATKGDVREAIQDLRAHMDKQFTDLYKWGATLLVAMTAIFATIVKVL